MKTWDETKGKRIDTPKKMKLFFKEIEDVCLKYNLSISHEDSHGGFIIEEYDKYNIDWLNCASKNYGRKLKEDN